LYNTTIDGGNVEVVVDTSALLAVLLEEPERPALIAATTGAVLLAPASLPWEVGNALVAAIRRQRLSAAAAQAAWAAYGSVPIRLVEVDIAQAIGLATELGVYAYDAYMLEAARSARVPLLTLDAALARAARSIGVSVMELPK
jgi:predicted nucleic acid-binding protein